MNPKLSISKIKGQVENETWKKPDYKTIAKELNSEGLKSFKASKKIRLISRNDLH